MLLGRVLAALPRTDAAAVVHDGPRTVLAFGADDAVIAPADPFATLDATAGGWWAGYAAYELGRAVERVAPRRPSEESTPIPPSAFVRFAARVELGADGTAEWFGHGAARRALERAVADPVGAVRARPQTSDWTSSLDRDEYEHRVLAIQELIRAGECYQVNLTRRLTGPPLDAVALWHALATGNPAPHAMFWRPPAPGAGAPTVVSASPERFLRVDGDTVETRPIKGTATDAAHAPDEREGPRRERDDRRPRPQRPRAGVPARHHQRPRPVRRRAPSGTRPPREHRPGHAPHRRRSGRSAAAPRSRPRRSPGRPSPG